MVSRMPSAQRSEELPPREEPPTVHRFGRSDGEAPTLVLLHGLTDSGRCWPDAVRRWSGDYRVVTWDARGHGESDRFTPDELRHGVGEIHLADLVAVLEQLAQEGITRPVLVGHSMGGGTAAALAGTRPELVRAVVLEDPALGAGRYSDADEAEGARRRVAEARETNAHPHHAMKQGKRDHPKWPKAEFKPWLEAKQQTDLEMLGQPSITVRTPWEEVTAGHRGSRPPRHRHRRRDLDRRPARPTSRPVGQPPGRDRGGPQGRPLRPAGPCRRLPRRRRPLGGQAARR